MKRSVLITGAAGAIGSALMTQFSAAGWDAIGVDKTTADGVLEADLETLASDDGAMSAFAATIREKTSQAPLAAIVNNAAVQHVGALSDLSAAQIAETMAVNVVAPMLIVRAFLAELRAAKGVVVNIGSVHAQSTKRGFSAYATSKSALHGLTRALAVDLGPDVRVNTLAPAATNSQMLRDGFAGAEAALNALEDAHPLQRIAEPEEIAQLAVFLTSDAASFLTGATLFADGGVLSRLHDPA